MFGPNGEEVDPDRAEVPGYRDQVIYINKQMIPLLQTIIAQSATPPIIIVQGDHGGVETSPIMRMHNLNAYYLPNGAEKQLYEKITPVNSFRVIFNSFFGGQFPLLKDTSYYSTYQDPYQFKIIPNTRKDCKGN